VEKEQTKKGNKWRKKYEIDKYTGKRENGNRT
jgi:hypothetical protein